METIWKLYGNYMETHGSSTVCRFFLRETTDFACLCSFTSQLFSVIEGIYQHSAPPERTSPPQTHATKSQNMFRCSWSQFSIICLRSSEYLIIRYHKSFIWALSHYGKKLGNSTHPAFSETSPCVAKITSDPKEHQRPDPKTSASTKKLLLSAAAVPAKIRSCSWSNGLFISLSSWVDVGMGQNPIPLVNIKIAGKWMFIPLKMVCIGIDP